MRYYSGEFFSGVADTALHYLLKNYDYYYLDYTHNRNRIIGAETLIIGTSHAMNGIIVKEMKGGYEHNINISVSSQDVYYDFKHIQKVVEEAKKPIERCVINFGYYMMYQDVSMSENIGVLVPSVWEPIFHDSHHRPPEEWDFFNGVVYDESKYPKKMMESFCDEWSRHVMWDEKEYYGEMGIKTRRNNNILGLKNVNWSVMSDEEKDEYGRERAESHNRLLKYVKSREENEQILNQMFLYMFDRGIKPVFVVFPFTHWYNQWISPQYKEDILRCLGEIPCSIDFLDMNDLDIFTDMDFLDSDHLNDAGASKATAVLNEFLDMI